MKNDGNWEKMYGLAIEYSKSNGGLDIGAKEIYKGERLGQWIHEQKKKYKNTSSKTKKYKKTGVLSKEQIKLLEDIGIIWDNKEKQWNDNYIKCVEYKKIHGTINTISNDDKKLRAWIGTQRHKFKKGELSKERINLLNELEIIWDEFEANWIEWYEIAKSYYNKFYSLQIPKKFVFNGFNIGEWISTQRSNYKKGKLSNDRKEKLDEIGMIWDAKIHRTSFYEQAIFYYIKQVFEDSINCYVDLGFELDIYIPSLKLAIEYDGWPWHKSVKKDIEKNKKCRDQKITLIRIRAKNCPDLEGNICKLKGESLQKDIEDSVKYILTYIKDNLKNINTDIVVDITEDREQIQSQYIEKVSERWNICYMLAKEYFTKNNSLNIPKKYETEEGVKLGYWICNQRRIRRGEQSGILTEEQIKKLDEIGMIWDYNELRNLKWNENFNLCKQHFERYGTLINIKENNKINGNMLNRWLQRLRTIYNKKSRGILTNEMIEALNSIGMIWDINEYRWEINYSVAKKYYLKNNHLRVTKECNMKGTSNLYIWILTQRQLYKDGKLSSIKVQKLNDIGMIWDVINDEWDIMYELAVKYKKEFGTLAIKATEKYMGKNLGKWISRQRQAYRGNGRLKISPERISKLELLGICWFPNLK